MPARANIDHLVLAAPTLDQGVAWVEATLGVRAAPGGRHPQWSTHNALLSLGDGAYLEILAADPDAPATADRAADHATAHALFGLALARTVPRLTTWMLRASPIDPLLAAALSAGVDLGSVRAGSRRRADGVELQWQIAIPPQRPLDGTVPWLIDWGWSQHPSRSAPAGCTLEWIELEHPEPDRVAAVLAAVGCGALRVRPAPQAAIVAGIACPRGVVVLR